MPVGLHHFVLYVEENVTNWKKKKKENPPGEKARTLMLPSLNVTFSLFLSLLHHNMLTFTFTLIFTYGRPINVSNA